TCALPILEAILERRHSPPHWVVGPGVHRPRLPRAPVEAGDVPAVAAREHHVGIILARRDPAALAAAHLVPVLVGDPQPVGAARDADRAVVLLRTAQPVREVGGRDDVVELRRGLVVQGGPGGPTILAHRGAAIVAVDHALGVARIDPEGVVVAVGSAQVRERLAAIHRFEERDVEYVDAVDVTRVRHHVREIPGPLPDLVLGARAPPGRAAVVRAEQAARVRLYERPHPIVAHGRDGEADLADDPFRKAAAPGDVLPRVPAVGRLPDAA